MSALPALGRYKHFKGGIYELLAIGLKATHAGMSEQVPEQAAIYRGEDGRIWIRDIKEFFGTVENPAYVEWRDGLRGAHPSPPFTVPRFTPIETEAP